MNNTFSFKRFKDLLIHDGKMYYRNFGITLLIVCSLPIYFMVNYLVFGTRTGGESRYVFINFIATMAMMVVPEKAYGKVNLSREGVGFAMLPASSLEKFFSMFFYCAIATPILALFGSYLVDTLLSFLPFSGMNGRIHPFSYELLDVTSTDPTTMAWQQILSSHELLGIDENTLPFSVSQMIVFFNIFSIVANLCFSAIFMLGNMVFKKDKKTGKTLLCVIAASFLLFVGAIFLFIKSNWFQNAVNTIHSSDEEQIEQIMAAFIQYLSNGMIWGLVALTVITIILYYFTYRKIKTQKY